MSFCRRNGWINSFFLLRKLHFTVQIFSFVHNKIFYIIFTKCVNAIFIKFQNQITTLKIHTKIYAGFSAIIYRPFYRISLIIVSKARAGSLYLLKPYFCESVKRTGIFAFVSHVQFVLCSWTTLWGPFERPLMTSSATRSRSGAVKEAMDDRLHIQH